MRNSELSLFDWLVASTDVSAQATKMGLAAWTIGELLHSRSSHVRLDSEGEF
jgi:hypothetical protein